MPFFEGNYNITKLKKNVKGEIIQLEINHKNVPLNASGLGLYAWKYSSSYIYSKELFVESVDNVTTYSGNPLAKATTGDYVAAHTNNIWKIGAAFYNADMTSGSAPAGTAGTCAGGIPAGRNLHPLRRLHQEAAGAGRPYGEIGEPADS